MYQKYNVRKDNTISYRGNFYTVPIGTHRNEGHVWITEEEEDFLIIRDSEKEIARHKILIGKGCTRANRAHLRDKNKDYADLMVDAANSFQDQDQALRYLEIVAEQNKRYIKDQLRYLLKFSPCYAADILMKALEYCIAHEIYHIPDFKQVLHNLTGGKEQEKPVEISLLTVDRSTYNMLPERSNINVYEGLINQN